MGADFTGILKDTKLVKCTVEKGNAVATGEVTNTSTKARDILIAVVWLKQNSGDSWAVESWTAKSVEAGKTVTWSVKAQLAGDASRCVIQAKSNVAGTLG